MNKLVKEIRIKNKNESPYFQLTSKEVNFPPGSTIVKVLAFSLDPVMRVWLSGAKTNYRKVEKGDIFNCFGVGVIERSSNEDYAVGQYVFGNTGIVSYFELTEQKQRECFKMDKQIVQKFGPFAFVYLINNGLAAYAGLQILEVKKGENVVVSTAAGATGLLLCHLLKKRGANIIAISSTSKQIYLTEYTDKLIDYQNRTSMIQQLKQTNFSKYFDNVGESQLDIILSSIQNHGILALCGAIENYLHPKDGGIKNYLNIISKRLKLQGINFSNLFWKAKEIFQEFSDAKLHIKIVEMDQFIPHFLEIFKKGGSIVGKVIIDPHK